MLSFFLHSFFLFYNNVLVLYKANPVLSRHKQAQPAAEHPKQVEFDAYLWLLQDKGPKNTDPLV